MTHAVLLHPYFAHGGGRRNRVISALYDRLLTTTVVPHRFDFSSMTESAAQAETEAQIEACGGPVVLIGYSFGAAVAATITHPAVVGWALIAPALVAPRWVSPASPLRPPASPPAATDPRPKLVVIAERDAWFGVDVIGPLVAGWVACEQQTVPSADHFFSATADDVADRAVTWAVAHAATRPTGADPQRGEAEAVGRSHRTLRMMGFARRYAGGCWIGGPLARAG